MAKSIVFPKVTESHLIASIVVDPMQHPFASVDSVSKFFRKVVSKVNRLALERSKGDAIAWLTKLKNNIDRFVVVDTGIKPTKENGRVLSKIIATMAMGNAFFRNVMTWSFVKKANPMHASDLKNLFFKNASSDADIAYIHRISSIIRSFGNSPYLRLVDVILSILLLRVYCTASNFDVGKSKDLVSLCTAIVHQLSVSAEENSVIASVMDPNFLIGHMPVCFGKFFLFFDYGFVPIS